MGKMKDQLLREGDQIPGWAEDPCGQKPDRAWKGSASTGRAQGWVASGCGQHPQPGGAVGWIGTPCSVTGKVWGISVESA